MPPIDASIISGLRPPTPVQAVDPLERYSKSLALQGLLGQQDLQGLQLQTAKQGLQDDAATRAAYITGGGDAAKTRAAIVNSGNYKALNTFDKAQSEIDEKKSANRKNSSAADKSEFDVKMGKMQNGAALLNEAKDDASWQSVLRVGSMTGTFPPEFVDKFKSEPYSPQLIQALQAAGLKRSEQLKLENDAAQTKETGRHNVETEANTVRGQDMTAATAKAGQGVTIRGQNLTDARAREANNKGQYDAERGVLVDPRTAVSRPVVDASGAPIAAKEKPLTESQGKATGMALRAQRANDILNALEDSGETNRGIIKQAAGHLPLIGGGAEMGVNMLPGVMGGPSENQQKVEQGRRDFINAVLRVESGASISPSEFQNAERQYFPMPGDTPAVIAQKRQARQTEIDGLKLQSGPGEKKITSMPKTKGIDPAKLSDAELKRELGL